MSIVMFSTSLKEMKELNLDFDKLKELTKKLDIEVCIEDYGVCYDGEIKMREEMN